MVKSKSPLWLPVSLAIHFSLSVPNSIVKGVMSPDGAIMIAGFPGYVLDLF